VRQTNIRFPALFLLSIVLTYLYAINFSTIEFSIYIGIIAITSLVLVKWGELYSFFTLITVIFASAFIRMYMAFTNSPSAYQMHILTEQTLGMAMVLSWWLLIVYTYREHREREKLQTLLESLEKIDPVSGVLTISELIDELFYITRTLSRRGEPATLIKLTIKGYSGNVPQKVLKHIGNILLESIRVGYDLVGREGNTFFIVLQGTDTKRANLVIERIKERIQTEKHINGKELLEQITFETIPLTHDFETNKNLLLKQSENI